MHAPHISHPQENTHSTPHHSPPPLTPALSCPGLPESTAGSAMVIEPSLPAEMADVDSEGDSEIVS